MAQIDVQRSGTHEGELAFRVAVVEPEARTRHDVTLSTGDYERLRRSDESPEVFVRRCFEFLLQRESKESILPEFDVSVISRYFPEFEDQIS